MVTLSEIRALIDAYIKTNGNQQITGHTMNVVLNEIVRILEEKKQDVLISGTNIKTINGEPILGEGNIVVSKGGESYDDAEIRRMIAAIAELVDKKEDKSNKVTALSESSTDVQYPSAKAVYAAIVLLKELIEENGLFIEDLYNNTIPKNADDYYPNIAVGTSDNLAGVDEVDSEFNFRQSGGGAITDGVARVQSIKGNSVVWNQLLDTAKYTSTAQNGVTFTKNADGSISVSTDANGATADSNIIVILQGSFKDHFLYLAGCPLGGSSSTYHMYDDYSGKRDVGNGVLWKSAENTIYARIQVKAGSIITTPVVFRPKITDLTQMFQAGNEPTTIEEFYSRIPQGVDLNAYNEGTIYDMKATGIISKGVNAWNEEWEVGTYDLTTGEKSSANGYIRSANLSKCLPSEKYYIKTTKALYILWYDNNRNYISNIWASNSIIQAPSNAAYLAFRSVNGEELTTYNNDICIGISGDWNGQYFPHEEASEDLSIVAKYFPDGMRSTNKSCYDEFRYIKQKNKREAMQRIGKVDLGKQNYTYQKPIEGTYPHGYFFTQIAGKAVGNSNVLCGKYNTIVDWVSIGVRGSDSSTNVYVKDSAYTDVASFKAAMSGVMLYYELAEPIVTEIEEKDFNLDYKVWNCGTEQMVATEPSSALSADITYGFNAIGKIKEQDADIAAIKAALAKAGITI